MTTLEAEALAAILLCDGYGLVPLTAEQRMKAALEVRSAGRSASTHDAAALSLRKRLSAVEQLLRPEIRQRLADTPLLWIESALPHASVVRLGSTQAILVCRGIFDFLHFQTTLNTVGSLLARYDAPVSTAPAEQMQTSELVNLAGHVILADSYAHLRPPATFADMLGPNARRDVELGTSTSLLLLVLHELAHVALGHTNRVNAGSGVSVEVVADPQSIDARRSIELAADLYSINAIADEWRSQLLSSAINLHNAFHMFEIFGVRPSKEYPTADERLAAMFMNMGLQGRERDFAESWLSDHRGRQAVVAAEETSPAGLVGRFTETLDIDSAYAIARRVRSDLEKAGLALDY